MEPRPCELVWHRARRRTRSRRTVRTSGRLFGQSHHAEVSARLDLNVRSHEWSKQHSELGRTGMNGACYDLLVIGGGINGVGVAADAAGRGLSVCLVEMGDLASGTSQASSKLIHGGLRYLE